MADIDFNCPACTKSLVIDEKGAGRTIKCPDCGGFVQVPAVAAEVPRLKLKKTPPPLPRPSPLPIVPLPAQDAPAVRVSNVAGLVVGTVALCLIWWGIIWFWNQPSGQPSVSPAPSAAASFGYEIGRRSVRDPNSVEGTLTRLSGGRDEGLSDVSANRMGLKEGSTERKQYIEGFNQARRDETH